MPNAPAKHMPPARAAYEADCVYHEVTPSWATLGPAEQRHWQAVADAAIAAYQTSDAIPTPPPTGGGSAPPPPPPPP